MKDAPSTLHWQKTWLSLLPLYTEVLDRMQQELTIMVHQADSLKNKRKIELFRERLILYEQNIAGLERYIRQESAATQYPDTERFHSFENYFRDFCKDLQQFMGRQPARQTGRYAGLIAEMA